MADSLRSVRKRKSPATESDEQSESPAEDAQPKSPRKKIKNKSPIKRRSFSIVDKLQILKSLDTESSIAVCIKYKISSSVIHKWQKKKAEYEEFIKKEQFRDRKKKKPLKNAHVDDALYKWYLEAKTSGIPISMPLLQSMALELNAELGGDTNFKASNGWFWRWKFRNGIDKLREVDEQIPVNTETVVEYKGKFSNIIKHQNLTRAQVFNFAETGLWYKTMPNKTLAAVDENQTLDSESQKERLTIGACCNADGSLKLPLIVISKLVEFCSLHDGSMENLPVSYKHQKNAWMDASIFKDWFKKEFVPTVKNFLREKNLPPKALLIIDDCKAYPPIRVGGFDTGFLPSNITLLVQPLDQGILQTLKRRYKNRLVSSILNEQKRNNTPVNVYLQKITMHDVIEWIDDSWKQISPMIIYKCWSKIWPIETRTIATQTEEEKEELVGAESEDTFIHGPDMKTEAMLNSLKQIHEYEMIDDQVVQEWITRVEDCDI